LSFLMESKRRVARDVKKKERLGKEGRQAHSVYEMKHGRRKLGVPTNRIFKRGGKCGKSTEKGEPKG